MGDGWRASLDILASRPYYRRARKGGNVAQIPNNRSFWVVLLGFLGITSGTTTAVVIQHLAAAHPHVP